MASEARVMVHVSRSTSFGCIVRQIFDTADIVASRATSQSYDLIRDCTASFGEDEIFSSSVSCIVICGLKLLMEGGRYESQCLTCICEATGSCDQSS